MNETKTEKKEKPRVVAVNPPEKCNICGGSLKAASEFYDCKTPRGPWAWMCEKCFHTFHCKVGIGLGQEYNSKTNEKIR